MDIRPYLRKNAKYRVGTILLANSIAMSGREKAWRKGAHTSIIHSEMYKDNCAESNATCA